MKRKKRSISKELIEGQLIRHVLVGLNRFDGGRLQCNNELLSIHQPFHRVPTQGYISVHVKTDALNFRTISLILIVDLICDNLSKRIPRIKDLFIPSNRIPSMVNHNRDELLELKLIPFGLFYKNNYEIV